MKYFFALSLLVSLSASAQTEEEKVKAPILVLFDGMRKSDSSMIRAAFAPTAVLQTVAKNKEGVVSVRTDAVNDFVLSVTKPHTDIYDERITFEMIKIDADLATVWTPYKFYVGEKFSHCGVNSFQLVRINGAWKIQYIIDTRRREGCL
jgi:hypothetical protein